MNTLRKETFRSLARCLLYLYCYIKTLHTICDALQLKVPYDSCYKLLVWYKYYSVIRAQQSFQVKRFNVIGCKSYDLTQDPTPLIMLQIKINGSKHSTVLNGLSYGMAHLFDSFVPRGPNQSCVSLLSSTSVYYWLVSYVCKSDTSGSRPKVPFAVTRNI